MTVSLPPYLAENLDELVATQRVKGDDSATRSSTVATLIKDAYKNQWLNTVNRFAEPEF